MGFQDIRTRDIDNAKMLEFEWEAFQRRLVRGNADYLKLVGETLEYTRDFYSGIDNTAKYERWFKEESDKHSPNHINLHSYLICFLDERTRDIPESAEKNKVHLQLTNDLLSYINKRKSNDKENPPSDIEQKIADEFLGGLDKPVKPKLTS